MTFSSNKRNRSLSPPDKLQSTFFSRHNFEKSCLLVEALKVDDFYKYLFDKIVFSGLHSTQPQQLTQTAIRTLYKCAYFRSQILSQLGYRHQRWLAVFAESASCGSLLLTTRSAQIPKSIRQSRERRSALQPMIERRDL